MKLYNATSSQLDLPMPTERVSIASMKVGPRFMPNKEFLRTIAECFTEKDVALILEGQHEISMCSQIDGLKPLCVNSLEEAIIRFAPSGEKELKKTENPAKVG